MKIGIEAERANLPQKTGVEVYSAQIIKHLAEIDNTNEYILYFRTKPQDWFYALPKNFQIKIIPFPKFWTQIRLSWEMIMFPVDVLFILASALPLIHPKNSIVTVHDIAFELFEGIYTGFMQQYQRWTSRFAVRHAAKVITISQSTKNDLVKVYKVDPEKIQIIPLGFDKDIFQPLTYEQAQSSLDRFGLVYQKYILFVGTLQPRKNISSLVNAFVKLKKEHHIEEKLVIVGKRGWLWEPIEEKIRQANKLTSGIKYLDYVEQSDLNSIIAGASLLTLPAFYEGFGLPPLEAMASGVPVVVSNVSSLPEVVGDAGKLIDPNSVDSIAAGLLEVLTDKELRKQMIEKGFMQANKFTWEETGKNTLKVLSAVGSTAAKDTQGGGESLK